MPHPISKSIIVNKPVREVYTLWADFENFPNFMQNIKSVKRTGDRVSHWVMNGPLGKDIEWDAIIVDLQENRRIAWNNADQSKDTDIRTTGEVTFRSLAPMETEVHATVLYEPKSGIGQSIAKLFSDPEDRLEEDLRNFKVFAEEGTVTGNTGGMKDTGKPRR
jgi:uncharacterized membrane protein